MEEKLPCDIHGEQIKTLFKRVDEMDDFRSIMHNLDKNMAVQTQMMQEIVGHNKRQDERMDKQDERMDKQDEKSAEQHKVMVQMSANLTELNDGYKRLGTEMKEVKDAQSANEKKYIIHTGELVRDFLVKIAIPLGIVGAIVAQVIKYTK